jgi:hypothetical protein
MRKYQNFINFFRFIFEKEVTAISADLRTLRDLSRFLYDIKFQKLVVTQVQGSAQDFKISVLS